MTSIDRPKNTLKAHVVGFLLTSTRLCVWLFRIQLYNGEQCCFSIWTFLEHLFLQEESQYFTGGDYCISLSGPREAHKINIYLI